MRLARSALLGAVVPLLAIGSSALGATGVVVTVVDTNGAPQSGLGVAANRTDGTQAAYQVTNGSGQTTFSLVAASYVFSTNYYNFDFTSTTCATPDCTAATITIAPPVTVTVVDTSGAPQANVGVAALDAQGSELNYVWTDGNGHAVMSVPGGPTTFSLMFGNLEFDSASCVVPGCTSAAIVVTQPITVSVFDTNGTPRAQVGVAGQDASGNEVNYATTDANGQASMSLPVGTGRFQVVQRDGSAEFYSQSCTVPGCTTATITVSVPVLATFSVGNLAIEEIGGADGISAAWAVNASGQIVGYEGPSDSDSTAFLWTPPGSVVNLGAPTGAAPSAISNSGVITGSVLVGHSYHVFSAGLGQPYTDLGPLGDDQPVVYPYTGQVFRGAFGWGVNDCGQITGPVMTGGHIRGFVYTPGQAWVDIGDLGRRSTWANAIASDGTVVGASQLPDSPTTGYASFGHAVMYRDGVLIDLNDYVDPTAGVTLVDAEAISDGYIVGTGLSGGLQVPFRFNRATQTVELLPTPWAGGTRAFGVNGDGEVIGGGYLDAGQTEWASFVYSDQLGFRNLGDLIAANSGWTQLAASGINDSGDVAGWGYHNGIVRAFRVRLSPDAGGCQDQRTNSGS